jgi:hypothetical protein
MSDRKSTDLPVCQVLARVVCAMFGHAWRAQRAGAHTYMARCARCRELAWRDEVM